MNIFRTVYNQLIQLLTRYPIASFLIIMILLFGTIFLGTLLRTSPPISESIETLNTKTVKVFQVGKDIAYMSAPALVKKQSVTTVVALTPGIVSSIAVTPGQSVGSGRALLSLTNDYRSSARDIEKQIAREQDALQQKLYPLEQRINQLERRKIERSSDLSDLAEEIELKKLKITRERLRSNRTISSLSVALAETSDAVLKPRTYTSGTVERIFVRPGDFVSPGTPLVSLRSYQGVTTLEALVGRETARRFDPDIETKLILSNKETVALLPTYFSRQETNAGWFSILYTLSDALQTNVSDGEYEILQLPLSPIDPGIFFVPLESVFQDNERAWVMVAENNHSVTKEIKLGNVIGNFVEVTQGLERGDSVILDRTVFPGETIAITQ